MRVGIFLVCFGLMWSGLVSVVDFVFGRQIVRQAIATGYLSTDGTVLASHVAVHEGHGEDESTTYGVELSFTYSVFGHQYTGTRYRYHASSSSDSAWAHEVVAIHSPGT